ncbi:hypothetical protein [Noviherbaspirillum malthae]|uniref:hypothetical protein n=1 Tax=Noviherbaspirillum malthae TaxID=1260987 RepID=UPI001890B5E0|nr:hypothetical protein [Noviherbaspirillum malthae]
MFKHSSLRRFMKRKILRPCASLSQIKPGLAGLRKCRNACDYPGGAGYANLSPFLGIVISRIIQAFNKNEAKQ